MTQEHGNENYPKPMPFMTMVFWTGLFGGIFWGLIGFIANFLSFTEIRLNVIIASLALGDWKREWQGTIVSIIILGLLSVCTAYIYSAVLKKFPGFWVGIGYGMVLFFLVFIILNPFIPAMKPFSELSRDTIITSICIYILYGIFIGYSINYEYQNNIAQEKEASS